MSLINEIDILIRQYQSEEIEIENCVSDLLQLLTRVATEQDLTQEESSALIDECSSLQKELKYIKRLLKKGHTITAKEREELENREEKVTKVIYQINFSDTLKKLRQKSLERTEENKPRSTLPVANFAEGTHEMSIPGDQPQKSPEIPEDVGIKTISLPSETEATGTNTRPRYYEELKQQEIEATKAAIRLAQKQFPFASEAEIYEIVEELRAAAAKEASLEQMVAERSAKGLTIYN